MTTLGERGVNLGNSWKRKTISALSLGRNGKLKGWGPKQHGELLAHRFIKVFQRGKGRGETESKKVWAFST